MDVSAWFKDKFNNWRLALLVFIVIYAFLLLGLGEVQIQWDEMPHLYGGLLLSHGDLNQYLSFYGFYPPLYDLLTAGAYNVFGVSLVAGRITAAVFALLAVWVVFEFAYKTYGPKVALITSIFLGAMPGFYWVSRFAMLESAVLFFFTIIMLFFYSWVSKNHAQNKLIFLCGLALGLAFLMKYQILVAAVVMAVSLLFLYRHKLRFYTVRFPIILVVAAAVVLPWLFVIGLGHTTDIMYAIQTGNEDRSLYSTRFSTPIFYLVELTWPYDNTHPILLPLYILGLLGLAMWAFRRKPEDKFFLIWFIVVYLFFTFLIPNRQWRYAMPLFSVLAISAASFVLFAYDKASAAWKSSQIRVSRRQLVKIGAAFLVGFVIASVAYSYYDGYSYAERYQRYVPVKEATHYAAEHSSSDQSILVLCGSNSFYEDMVRFYLNVNGSWANKVLQYPLLPIDTFKPDLNMTTLAEICQYNNVKYILLYEYGATDKYFNSTWDTHHLMIELNEFGPFVYETWFPGFPGSSVWIYTYTRAE